MSGLKIMYVKSDLKAFFAYRLWYTHGVPIGEAAKEFDVSRDEVMESFRLNNPIRYRLFMAKLHFALGLAAALAGFHSRLKRLRDAIERSTS